MDVCLPRERHKKGKEKERCIGLVRVDRAYSVSSVYYPVYRDREELFSVCLPIFHLGHGHKFRSSGQSWAASSNSLNGSVSVRSDDLCVSGWICIMTDSFWRSNTWLYRRGFTMTSLSGNTGSDSVGEKVLETIGYDDQKRSNQCHYICIK